MMGYAAVPKTTSGAVHVDQVISDFKATVDEAFPKGPCRYMVYA